MIYLHIALAIIFSIISGISKSITDLSDEGKLKGNPKYWIKDESWIQKWKDGDNKKGEKFWQSSGIFVSITDAWHLFGLIERVSFVVTYVNVGILTKYSPWFWFMLLCYPLFFLVFHLFHDTLKVFKK